MGVLSSFFMQHSNLLASQIDELDKRSFGVFKKEDVPDHDPTVLIRSKLRHSIILLQDGIDPWLNCMPVKHKKNIVTKGFSVFSNKNIRDEYEHYLVKAVRLKYSNNKAVGAYTALSHLLSMFFKDKSYLSDESETSIRFKAFSPKLSNNVSALMNRSKYQCNDPSTLKMMRLRRSLSVFEDLLGIVFGELSNDIENQFLTKGLEFLRDPEQSAVVEYIGVNAELNRSGNEGNHIGYTCKFDEALNNIRSMFFKCDFVPFSRITFIDGTTSDISRLMSLSLRRFTEVKELAQKVVSVNEKRGLYSDKKILKSSVNKLINYVMELLEAGVLPSSQNDAIEFNSLLSQNKDAVLNFTKNRTSPPHELNSALKIWLPEIYGERRVVHLRTEKDLFDFLTSISAKFSDEYRQCLNELRIDDYETPANRIYFIKSFVKFLFTNKDKLKNIMGMLRDGVAGLYSNKAEGFLLLDKYIVENDLDRMPFSSALQLYNHVTNSNITFYQILPYTASFKNPNNGRTTTVNLSFLANNYRKLYDNLIHYIDVQEIRRDGGKRQSVTISSVVSSFISVFTKYHSTLSETDIENLKVNGVSALKNAENALLRHIRQSIQVDTKTNKLSVESGMILQNAIDKLLDFFGLDRIKSYKVKGGKNKQLKARRNKKKFYSFEQVVKIAYTIERCFKLDGLSSIQLLSLHAARLIIKTGWNLTPTLELDNDDIFYFDTALQGSRTPAVRLLKRRARYKTQWYDFKDEIGTGTPLEESETDKEVTIIKAEIDAKTALNEVETGKKVTAVIRDIETIRDLTSGIAENHESESLRKRIFAYRTQGRVQTLSAQSFTSSINRLLSNDGCKVRFSAKKIRTKGLNHTYRKVAQHFKKYQKAGQHSAQVFYESYLQTDNQEVTENLSNATSVMSDYFVRGVTDKVTFVESPPEESKKTPNGPCVQPKGADVIAIFKVKNRNLLSDDEATSCADFAACLFCEFYRCVADAEHVWRLLSYEAVVISRMISASASISSDEGTMQEVYIEKINERVQLILNDLSNQNQQAIPDGKRIFEQQGVHPDWEIA